jgi:co-chaperonin GroES (HSP10)
MNTLNTSGVEPLGRAVLIRPELDDTIKNSSLIIPDDAKVRLNMLEQRATVIEVGPGCWPDEPARAVPGDMVLVSKFAGFQMQGLQDKQMYRLINDRDIFARIINQDN